MAGMAQMSLYQDMPFSLCQPGPERVDGVGNYYLQIFAPGSSQLPLSTLYFLDSHGQIPSKIRDPDYDPIKQSQIDWSHSLPRHCDRTAMRRTIICLWILYISRFQNMQTAISYYGAASKESQLKDQASIPTSTMPWPKKE